jgi:hypothetical protein
MISSCESAQAEKAENEHHDDDKTDEIDDFVHGSFSVGLATDCAGGERGAGSEVPPLSSIARIIRCGTAKSQYCSATRSRPAEQRAVFTVAG